MALHVRIPLLIVIVLALAAVLVACGPAAPSPADDPAGIVSPPTQGVPQDAPQDAPHTELGLVFDAPANTPWPTLVPDPPGVAEAFAREQAEQVLEAQQESPPVSVAEITQQARDFSQGYPDDGAIVRAEVTAHRVVEPDLDITWPDRMFSPPYFFKRGSEEEYAGWRRSTLKINETYFGNLPQGYEIVAPEFAPNQALEAGKEYILYVVRYHVAEDELPGVNKIHRYNAEQLAALGGPAGLARLDSNWVIDGDTAWQITEEYVLTPEVFTPVLDAARANGGNLPLVDLEAAIRAGVGN